MAWGGAKKCTICSHNGVTPNEKGVYVCDKCHHHWKIAPRACPKCHKSALDCAHFKEAFESREGK